MGTVTPRLDLDEKVLVRAKKALAKRKQQDPETADLTKIPFSETAEFAIDLFGTQIINLLRQAGLAKQDVVRGRPRRVSEDVWLQLGKWSDEFDISRISILRAALALMAKTYREPSSNTMPGTGSLGSKK